MSERYIHNISKLLNRLKIKEKKSYFIATVESATGGRIADVITNVSGSSDYFKGAVVAYSNEIKMRILKVRKETIDIHGAVSYETAVEMAEGGRKLFEVDICLSDTGIAGPTGATPSKPVGLFYIGLADENSATAHKYIFEGSRENNKNRAVYTSINLLEEYLLNKLGMNSPIVKRVVTCFIMNKNKLLILRRSNRVGTYQGRWSAVSGYIEDDIENQTYREIEEETNLSKHEVKLINKGVPLHIFDENIDTFWIVYPYLFKTDTPKKIKIDWENLELKWINPNEIDKFETVPGLREALDRVYTES